MQLGMIGLGRMGANMVRRLLKAGHQCVVFDRSPKAVEELVKEKAVGSVLAARPREEAGQAASHLADGPGGRRGQDHRATSCPISRPATSSSTAATPTTSTTSAAPRNSAPKQIHYVDVGTSGGVWGLERGYCMMIGGPDQAVQHLDPIFKTLAPGVGDIPRTPGREKIGGTAEQGYLHCGPNGAGHFVKMVHNGIEYGIMAAYAEGLAVLRSANVGKQTHEIDAETTPLARPRALPVRPQPARHRRGVAARQRDRLLAARPDGGRPGQGPRALGIRRPGLGLGRGPLDDQGRHRRGACRCPSSPRRSTSASPRAARRISRTKLLSAMRFQFGGHLEKPAGK